MKKLSLFASVSAALVCAAVPVSLNWSAANVTLFSLDTAEAKVGRPLTATSVAGVSRRVSRRAYRRTVAGALSGCQMEDNPFLRAGRTWAHAASIMSFQESKASLRAAR